MSDPVSNLDPVGETPKSTKRTPLGCVFQFIVIGSIFAILFGVALGPIHIGIRNPQHNTAMQQSRQIGQLLFSYSVDNTANGNRYPDGKSSTEIFQKLIDGGYATDPSIFYVQMPGKVKAVAGQKLKPENVCWDVTSGVDSSSSDLVPLVFLTGFKVSYLPGGSAVPMIKPYPPFWHRTWSDFFAGDPAPEGPGIAIFYKGNNAVFKSVEAPDYTLPNMISADFKPDGHTYRQLTPDGVLQ